MTITRDLGAGGFGQLVQCCRGEEDLLDRVHRARADRRFRSADLVGAGGDDPDCICELVGSV